MSAAGPGLSERASTAKVPPAPAPMCEGRDEEPDDASIECWLPAVARALISGVPTWVCDDHAWPGDLPLAQVSHLL